MSAATMAIAESARVRLSWVGRPDGKSGAIGLREATADSLERSGGVGEREKRVLRAIQVKTVTRVPLQQVDITVTAPDVARLTFWNGFDGR